MNEPNFQNSKIWVKHSGQFRLGWSISFGRITSKVLLENLDFCLTSLTYRHVTRSENLGGHVVMRRAAASRWRLLICQNLGGLGGRTPPCFPL